MPTVEVLMHLALGQELLHDRRERAQDVWSSGDFVGVQPALTHRINWPQGGQCCLQATAVERR